MNTQTASIEIADLPKSCPSCGHETNIFPLAVRFNRAVAECPACYAGVADIVVVRRATVNELLGADPDWTGGQSVDDYVAEQRTRGSEYPRGDTSEGERTVRWLREQAKTCRDAARAARRDGHEVHAEIYVGQALAYEHAVQHLTGEPATPHTGPGRH